jgi:hypothetical protein
MRLLAVLVTLTILLLTVGCSCEPAPQPTVQPQPVLEIPTYQGETQYDYKAGAPDVLTNPEIPIETIEYAPVTPPPAPEYSGHNNPDGSWYRYYYTPPAPIRVEIYGGTVAVNVGT